ncbi:hypothetical protein V8E51_017690 [Hyaloscypha variabilis]
MNSPGVPSDVIIIGAGMPGICAGIQLQSKFKNATFEIFDKGNDIGGTWSKNTYPNLSCDIPSQLFCHYTQHLLTVNASGASGPVKRMGHWAALYNAPGALACHSDHTIGRPDALEASVCHKSAIDSPFATCTPLWPPLWQTILP